MASLRDAAAAADAGRFVGRAEELDEIAALFDDADPRRILYVHGPGGIGKSTLLRAAGRLATARGFTAAVFDARSLPVDPDGFMRAVEAGLGERTFLIIDEADTLRAALVPIRERLLDALPASARLAFGGREAPDPSWRAEGLDALLSEVLLGPLGRSDAVALLRARGVDPARVAAIAAWAQGSPLALTVAATAPDTSVGAPVEVGLEQRLVLWLSGRPTLDIPADVLAVAALVRAVDARLLAAALPGRSTRDEFRRLAALPVVDRFGDAVTLHSVLAAAIRARMRATAPDRVRPLIRRIVEHLAGRARLGDIEALVEMSCLIDSPPLRLALANEPSANHYADTPRPGEFESFARQHGFDTGPDWPEVARWAGADGVHTVVMRRIDGTALLYGAFVSVARLHAESEGQPPPPIAASFAAAATEAQLEGERSFAGIVLFADASPQEREAVARLGSGAFMRLHGVADMRAVLTHYPEPDRRPVEVVSAIAHPFVSGPRRVMVADFGAGGAVGFIENTVLSEQGFARRSAGAASLLARTDDPVRRAKLAALLDAEFDRTPADHRLRRVIALAHLEGRSEQECLEAMHVSRRTWYRLLREARQRVLESDAVAAASTAGTPASG